MRMAKPPLPDSGVSDVGDESVVVSKKTSAAASSIFGTPYINLNQAIRWIAARESVPPPVFDYPVTGTDLRELECVIAGEAKPQSWTVVSLLELRTALELGRVRATARRYVTSRLFGGSGKPRILPPHFWPHLKFVNREVMYNTGKWPWQERTCVCFKDCRGAEFWSDILFRADEVTSVWPAQEADRSSEEEGSDFEKPAVETHVAAQPELRRAPDASIHRAILEEYDAANAKGLKAPNLKEIIPAVQKRLKNAGFEASGRRIQKLAADRRYQGRRREPGKTIASELRRK
jgi:hypothetical protein